jgi:hypothetical protein
LPFAASEGSAHSKTNIRNSIVVTDKYLLNFKSGQKEDEGAKQNICQK